MKKEFINQKGQSAFNLNGLTSPLMAIVLLVLGEILGGVLLGIAAVFIAGILGQPLTPFFVTILTLFSFAFISLAVLAWARLVEKSPWHSLGLIRKNALRDFVIGWGIGGAMLTLCVVIMILLGVVTITGVQFSGQFLLQFLLLILAWSIQGTTEELLTRGWMFPSLASKHNIPVGILISSLFFTAMHLGNNAIDWIPLLDLLLFGILTCLLMLKTGNLWVVGGLHAAWNCFQGNVFAFPVSGTDTGAAFIQIQIQGPTFLSGGDFGVEGSIVSLIVQTLIIAWLIYDLYFKEKKEK